MLANKQGHMDYVKAYTNASFLIRDDFDFKDGLFSATTRQAQLRQDDLAYQLDKEGYALVDETLENPRCVWQLMKSTTSRYTPEVVEKVCARPRSSS